MIALFTVKIIHKRTKEVMTTEAVANTPENFQEEFYQRRALRSLGHNPHIEKYLPENFKFEATIKQVMEK